MTLLRIAAVALLSLLFLATSNAHPAAPGLKEEKESITNDKSSIKDGRQLLIIDFLTKDRVDGSFVKHDLGCGIVFNSTRDSLLVSTLNGTRLLSAEEKVGPVRLLSIGEREFIQHRETEPEDKWAGTVQDYAIPKHHGSYAGNSDGERFTKLLSKLKKVDSGVHVRVLQKSMKRVLSEPEMDLLHDAAVAMGRRGVTGRDFPSALPLYLTAMRLDSRRLTSTADLLHTSDVDPSDEFLHGGRMKRDTKESSVCLKECPPCKEEKCLGMCGRSCSCWEWACGDCCYHKGCFYHDVCCRKRPFSLACWIPMDFCCDKEYVCKDPW